MLKALKDSNFMSKNKANNPYFKQIHSTVYGTWHYAPVPHLPLRYLSFRYLDLSYFNCNTEL